MVLRDSDIARVWNKPGNPRIWSPCQWVMRILVSFIGESSANLNCLWVPSPQSTRIFSFLKEHKIAVWFRFTVGIAFPVPRKVILRLSITDWRKCDLNKLGFLFSWLQNIYSWTTIFKYRVCFLLWWREVYFIYYLLFIILFITSSFSVSALQGADFAIYTGSGTWQPSITAFEKFLEWKNLTWEEVSAWDINHNDLRLLYRGIFLPGGWAYNYKKSIHDDGDQHLRDFLSNGGPDIGMSAAVY